MKLSIWLTRFSLVVVVLTAAIGLSMVGCGNSNQGSDVSENIDIIQTNCLSFDRVSHHVYPPAGIQIGFRLLDCDGYPVKRLGESNLTVINDEKGQPFGKGKKGGGVSAPGTPSEFGLYSILVLDMSDSIFRNDAVDDVLDGAKVFVKKVVSDADEGLKHKVAIMVFGMPSKTEIVQDFTDDAAVLNNVLDGLRSSSSLGTTDLYGSYQKAAAAVAAKGGDLDVVERSVIILTDGTHEAGDEENMRGNALTAKAQYEDAGVTFFSIGIKGEYDEERIRELASKADYFVLADDASSLTGIFGDISARVKALADSNYVVGVCTPVVFGSPTLTLKVNLDGTTADHTLAYSVGNLTGDVANCNPDWILNPCEGLECGSGHVGGVNCGKCDGGYSCQSGQCVEDECVPNCSGRECGLDPVCGQSCGTCDGGYSCQSGQCVEDECVPNCSGRECGLDPVCGQSCGTCDGGYSCQSGDCVKNEVPGEMILIPAGVFWMGCNSEIDNICYDDEKPYHEVQLSAYYIDKTEVTQGAYKKCVDAGVCSDPGCNWNPSGTPNRPVVCVDWNDAIAYCTWAGKRLPTEAEWEKAARGTDGRKYPWGNQTATCEYAVINDGSDYGCGTDSTWDVCSKSPAGDSPYGLCDMAGNVWEWVSDWYGSDYYSNSPASNPTGPVSGSYRVLRGGSFVNYYYYYYFYDYLRASSRFDYNPSDVGDYLGFRCSRSQ